MQKIITLLKYIFIGIVQGISEILPISSSGHLAILYNIFNIQESEQLNLTVFLHLASSIALCIYFKNEIIELIKGSFDYLFLKQKNNKSYFLLSI